MKSAKIHTRIAVCLAICGMIMPYRGNVVNVQAKTVTTSIRAIKVGQRFRMKNAGNCDSFKSGNTKVASVDERGVVTGKKKGTVRITARKDGKTVRRCTVKVKKKAYKPDSLPVTFSEVSLKEVSEPTAGAPEKIRYESYITNHARATIKKILYYYKAPEKADEPGAGDGADSGGSPASPGAVSGSVVSGTTSGSAVSGETGKEIRIILKAEDIKPGKTVRAERTGSNGNEDQFQLENEQLVKIELYAGKALYVYHVDTETYNFKWGTKDKKAPVISGFVKGKSATGYGDIYRVYYADMKKQYHYTQFVKARDNRDGPVKVKADTSGINWKKEGVYKLRFSATDRSGNTAKSWAKVRVYLPGSAESAADQILRSITRKSWSQEKKARAIYRYIRGHSSYIPHSAHGNWRQAGLRGLRYRSGDCYSFYATARLLLTRAGITNVMVKASGR